MMYIILPVYNRKEITRLFIECLVKQTYKNFKLILIDDGSTDGTSEMVLSYFPETVVIKGDGNLWWAGALQKGYEWLIKNAKDSDFCLIINDDVFFEQDFLAIGVNRLKRLKKTLLLATTYSLQTGELLERGIHFDFKKLTFSKANTSDEVNCLSTRGLFLKVEDFKNIGGFYPKILPHYLSDYEFTIRAYRKNYKLVVDEKLKLFMNESTTGYHNIKYTRIFEYYSKYFSKRNPGNPIYWLSFVYLTVPYPYKILHVIRILLSFARDLLIPVKDFLNFKIKKIEKDL